MSDLIKEPAHLLTEVPITTFDKEGEYNELHMATIARALYELEWQDKPSRRQFTASLLEAMNPWLPTSKEGRMSKRLANYMFKHHRLDMPQPVGTTIGSYLAACVPPGGWTFDITNHLNWRAGDFGDREACFLLSRKYVLEAMQEEGVHAIRFYGKGAVGEEIRGHGRAWVAPSEHGPVVFNAYGTVLSLVQARIKQLLPDHPQYAVPLTNLGENSSHLYINTGIGILVGGEAVEKVDLQIYCSKDRPVICYGCGQRTPQARTYTVCDDEGAATRVCHECYNNHWALDYITHYYFRKTMLEEIECVTHGPVSADGHYYEGAVIKVWALPANLNTSAISKCDHCQRLTDGQLWVSVAGKREVWCYMCAHEAPWECRTCSTYLPEDETTCHCGGTRMRRRL